MSNRRYSLINRPANASSVQDGDIDSETATDGWVLTADGAGGAAWEAASSLDDGTVQGSGLVWNGSAWVEALDLGNHAFKLNWTGTDQVGEVEISSDGGAAALSMISNADGSGSATARYPRFHMQYVVTGTDPDLAIGLNRAADQDCYGATFTGSTVTNWGINAKGASNVGLELGKGKVMMRIDQTGVDLLSNYSGRKVEMTSSLIPSTWDWTFTGHTGWVISGCPQVLFDGTVKLGETTAAASDSSGYGQLWVKDDIPNTLWFTDDGGTDYQLGVPSSATTSNTFPYKFSTSTDVTNDPGSGYFRFSTAVPDDNFTIGFSAFDTDGVDRTSEWVKYAESGTRIIIKSTDGSLYYDLKSASPASSIASYDWESNHRVEGMVVDTTVPDNDETIWVTIETDQALPRGTVRTTHDSTMDGACLRWRDAPGADGWWEDNRIRLKPGQYSSEIEFHGSAEQFCDITGTARTMTLNSIAAGTSYIIHNADRHQFIGYSGTGVGLEVNGLTSTVTVNASWTLTAPNLTSTGAISAASFAAPGGGISGATGTYTGAVTASSYGGIAEANLVDKSAAETIAGTWTFSNTIVQDYVAPVKYLQCRTETTTNIESITHAVNTDAGKVAGAMIFNSTTNKPLWATGDTDGATWVDATGSTAHTPA